MHPRRGVVSRARRYRRVEEGLPRAFGRPGRVHHQFARRGGPGRRRLSCCCDRPLSGVLRGGPVGVWIALVEGLLAARRSAIAGAEVRRPSRARANVVHDERAVAHAPDQRIVRPHTDGNLVSEVRAFGPSGRDHVRDLRIRLPGGKPAAARTWVRRRTFWCHLRDPHVITAPILNDVTAPRRCV